MAFPDFPFSDKTPSFMSHEFVQSYLESYCDHFNLRKYIQFKSSVELVRPVIRDNVEKWEISVKNLKDDQRTTEVYDAVLVCNGHYFTPQIPNIPGKGYFKGEMIHSHTYRHPEAFKDKKVVVLGAASSGTDITLDTARHAKSVFISHRTPRIISALPDNVTEVEAISEFGQDGKTVIFEDGVKTEADTVIFCTGYLYDFPFLHHDCDIEVEEGRVKFLYNHLINASHPSMTFPGICLKICPFPQFHYQVLYSLGALDGTVQLPTKHEMLQEIEKDYKERLDRGLPHRAAHLMGGMQWAYNDYLADAAKVPRLPNRVQDLYEAVSKTRNETLCDYKNNTIKHLDDGSYQVVESQIR